jgi:hypothetical protein
VNTRFGTSRFRGGLVVVGVISICAGAVWLVDAHHKRIIDSRASLLSRLPAKESVILEIDFAALRRAGLIDLLANSKTPEEAEYRQFVSKTEFDYKQDLDLALASFGPTGKYFLLKGRFDWNRLNTYVRSQGGECYNTTCRMSGSTPDRKISFFPLRPGIMALAVSKDEDAVTQLLNAAPDPRPVAAPVEPVSLSFSPAALKSLGALPSGTQIFARSLEDAEEVILSLGPQGKDFQLTLNARCRSDHDAEVLAAELERNTTLLRSMIARENRTPNPRDLSGVLTSGTFTHAGPRATGHWPISHGFIEDSLTGGS